MLILAKSPSILQGDQLEKGTQTIRNLPHVKTGESHHKTGHKGADLRMRCFGTDLYPMGLHSTSGGSEENDVTNLNDI